MIPSLAVHVCVDNVCSAGTSVNDASAGSGDGGADAGPLGGEIDLYESTRQVGGVAFWQVSRGSYQVDVEKTIASSGVKGHVTLTITSGGTPIYQASAQASCTNIASCGGTSEECDLQLP